EQFGSSTIDAGGQLGVVPILRGGIHRCWRRQRAEVGEHRPHLVVDHQRMTGRTRGGGEDDRGGDDEVGVEHMEVRREQAAGTACAARTTGVAVLRSFSSTWKNDVNSPLGPALYTGALATIPSASRNAATARVSFGPYNCAVIAWEISVASSRRSITVVATWW